MSGALAEIDYLRAVAARLARAGHGSQGSVISEAAAFLNVSKQTLYNRLRKVGWSSDRKVRTDKGDSEVSRDEVIAVAAIMASTRRQNGKLLLPVADAIDIAVANERLRTKVAPSTMLRLMKAHSCHPDMVAAADPHVNMRSLHPNHVWQLDASLCVLYRLRNGKVGVLDQRKFNERKPRDLAKILNERVLRYVVTDHYTGGIYGRYYETAGEDQETLFEFLMAAFGQKPEGMHGVPMMLVWDAGSANMAHGIQNLLTQLMVRHWPHIPGNPRAKGQVESSHNIWERKFEGRLPFVRIECVEQLNAHADTWQKAFNGAANHSRHGHTRWGLWQTIRQDQLRLAPAIEICRELLFAKPQTRVVKGNLTISFTCKGHEPAVYSVVDVPNVRVGDQLTITSNPYRVPNIFVVGQDESGGTRYIECTPIAKDVAGFAFSDPVWGESFASHADTVADTARKDVNELAFGERDALDAANARAKGRLAFDGEIDPFRDLEQKAAEVPAHMQRRGTELHLPNPVQTELKPLSHVEALFELRARLGRAVEADEAAKVREWFPDGVPETEFDALLQRLTNPESAQADRPRLYAVQ